MNCRRLSLGIPGPQVGVPPVVHGPAEVHEGAHGDAGRDLGDEGIVLPLAGVEGLADVLAAGPRQPIHPMEPVGADREIVAEPVDGDGLAAVFFLPNSQVDWHLCAGGKPSLGAGVLAPEPGRGGLWAVGHDARSST